MSRPDATAGCLSWLSSGCQTRMTLADDTVCPLWGLPSRVPQHRKSLCLSVCLSVCTDFRHPVPSGICAGFKRRCHSVYFQRCSKGVPKKSTFKEDWSDFQGTVFFRTFSDFCAILGTRLGSLQRGRTALRVQSS